MNRQSAAFLLATVLALAGQSHASSDDLVTMPARPEPARQVAAPGAELALYGLPLKGVQLEAFTRAADRAGAMWRPKSTEGFPVFSVDQIGVPGMQQFLVVHDNNTVLSVQFALKDDAKENLALRRLLVRKYGPPMIRVKPRAIGSTFTGQDMPQGVFEWHFLSGMRLTYQHAEGTAAASLMYSNTQALAGFGDRRRADAEQAQADASAADLRQLQDKF